MQPARGMATASMYTISCRNLYVPLGRADNKLHANIVSLIKIPVHPKKL